MELAPEMGEGAETHERGGSHHYRTSLLEDSPELFYFVAPGRGHSINEGQGMGWTLLYHRDRGLLQLQL